jgi:hypothetical protein
MITNQYHFVTRWRMKATVQEVTEILGDASELPRWWPSVYLEVKILAPGHPDGLGRRIALYTKGWLPYTLRWNFEVIETTPGLALRAEGDFEGTGRWTFEQDGEDCLITYQWDIAAQKPLLKTFSFLLKPIFKRNHEWAMQMGEQSLLIELARRRNPTATHPSPPPPTPSHPVRWLIAVIGGAS